MKDWVVEHKVYVLFAIVVIFGGLYFLYFNHPPSTPSISSLEKNVQTEQDEKKEVESNAEKIEMVMVDIKGQVKHPGVYQSSQGERVIDVIQKAGGLTSKANEDGVNLAEKIRDEMVIYIPEKGEKLSNQAVISSGSSNGISGNENESKINLNTADENGLQNIPGIGPSKAAAIVAYRNENGPFKVIEDLKNISGIGEKTFEKLKESITVQ